MDSQSRLAPVESDGSEQLRGLSPEIVRLLGQPLDRKLVARRKAPGGEMLRYLEGHVVVEQANRIFGFGNWGSELVGPIDYRPLAGDDSGWHGMYTATVRVTIRGCEPHADVGTGTVSDSTPEGHDTAIKAAVTDGLKRGFRFYGQQFGLGLYNRANAERISAANERADLRATVLALGPLLGLDDARSRKSAQAKAGRPFNRLTCPELAAIVRAMAEAVTRRQKTAA